MWIEEFLVKADRDKATAVIRQWSQFFAVLAVVLMTLPGCGGDSMPETAPAEPTQPTATPDAAPAPAQTTQQPAADDPRSKTRWVGNIPYDVFYDQPLAVAAETSSLTPSAPILGATTPSPELTPSQIPAAEDLPSTPTTAATTGDGPDWETAISAEVLNEAVTKLRNELTTNLNTLATYNRNIEAIANDGACLAALAAVAEVHPQAVSWQDNAKYVRDLGYQIYTNADGTGRGPFDATKLPFEQIVAVLNGGPPPEMEAEDQLPFADVADRSELMKRIKKSFDFLRTDVTTEARFQESPDDVVREASVLASFGGLISTESYDSADQEKYQQFVRDFLQANVDVAAASKAGDFSAFEAARSRIQKACNDCHAEYAFGNEGL
jgi:hypothetical protein